MKKILGIQKDHNASACLLYDDKIIYYNQEERLWSFWPHAKPDLGKNLFVQSAPAAIRNRV